MKKLQCLKCNTKFGIHQNINGKIHNVCNRKYCLQCSPFGSRNTKKLHLPSTIHNIRTVTRILITNCLGCSKDYIYAKGRGNTTKYCSSCTTRLHHLCRKLKSVAYKGGKCISCGYNKCLRALEFHHRNPKEKLFDIAQHYYKFSWEKIKEELDKCDLLCSNCHRELEESQTSKKILELVYMDKTGNQVGPSRF